MLRNTAKSRLAAGVVTVTALSAFGVALGTAAQARPASFSKCPGSYKATVTAAHPPKGLPAKWTNTVSQVTEQGTTCSNGHSVAGAYARKACGVCNNNFTLSGYSYKYVESDNLEGYVTAKHGSITVKFYYATTPKF